MQVPSPALQNLPYFTNALSHYIILGRWDGSNNQGHWYQKLRDLHFQLFRNCPENLCVKFLAHLPFYKKNS